MGPKRKCTFSVELQEQYPFLKKGKWDSTVLCSKCLSNFSISHGGRNDIEKHLQTDKHKSYLAAAASSSKMDNYCRNTSQMNTENQQLAAEEGLFAFHTVFHNNSFRSMDCTSKILQKLYKPKFSCARTKAEAIVTKVFAPDLLLSLQKQLETVNFITVFSDASNHKDLKLFPTLVRFFDKNIGINVKIIDLTSLPGETSDIIFNHLNNILKTNKLETKIAAYCADNANTNFGGVQRKGTNNIFFKLNENLEQSILGVGCAAHIIHNSIHTAANLLPVDIESIIAKIYSYFYIYTVRVETLKEFCEDVEVRYQKILGYSKTRWLALLPAVERILKMFAPLKSYFLSIDKCPQLIKSFFESESSEIWLLFIHNNASLFQDAITKVEGDKNHIVQVHDVFENLKNKLKSRLENVFIPTIIRNELTKLEDNGQINKLWFINHIKNFYATCLEYLNQYSTQYESVSDFAWISLKKAPTWEQVHKSYEYLLKKFPKCTIVENDLFDETHYVVNYISESKLLFWSKQETPADLKWVEIFIHFDENSIPSNNILKLVQYILCLPGTNASTERVFSMINKMWTTEKSNLSVETLKALVTIKYNFKGDCLSFYNELLKNNPLLRKIHQNEKYM